ncbi:MAG: DUF971 domain-containing protein [Pirellulaceae bacterium]|nr:DUF971 domain-containing protein [Pirellulaceae bacterium]
MLHPVSLAKTNDRKLEIRWNDDLSQLIPYRILRDSCPCATCREKADGKSQQGAAAKSIGILPILSAAEARPLDIVSMQPVGNYAYHIKFSDGHSTGIFTFEFLRSLSDEKFPG